jgi:predicted Zn-dependent peptidase
VQGGNGLDPEEKNNRLNEEKAYKVASFNGIDVFWIRTDKFKTCSINIFFLDNLTNENAALNALVPAVMRRGCARYPTFRDISMRLEELYGASFDCGVSKKGEVHIIQFYMEFLADKYAESGAGQFDNGLGLLNEIINAPLLKDDAFSKEYVDLEKDNLKNLILNRVNDKMQYSLERCFEEMCKNEPFGIYEYGRTSDLDAITPETLYGHYRSMMRTFPMKVYITGEVEESSIMKLVAKLSSLDRGEVKKMTSPEIFKKETSPSEVTERMNISQGKLTLGFRTNIPSGSPDYYALMVYSSILGGGVHSKLFQNVREKASLAYYAFSRLEKFKGLMIISSGIEFANKDKAKEIILKQLDDMKNGKITDEEFEATMKSIETGLKSLRDSQMPIVDFNLGQEVAGTDDSFDNIIEKVCKVGRDDVIRVAGNIKLDTVYFLTSEEGVKNEES